MESEKLSSTTGAVFSYRWERVCSGCLKGIYFPQVNELIFLADSFGVMEINSRSPFFI